MREKGKEIIAGRAFYFMPSPFCALKITIDEPYIHERMERAISELEKVHPVINNVVVQEDTRLWFRDTGRHVRICRYSESMDDWKTVYKTEASETVDLSVDPGVKIAVLEHQDCFDLLFLFHHIYADGISAKRLLADLIGIYCTGEEVAVREALSDVGAEVLERNVPISQEVIRRLDDALQVWERNKVSFDFNTFRQMNELHHKLARYELTIGGVEENDFLKLRKQCKEHGVTVNSALAAAILAGIQAREAVNTVIPVNVRPFLGIENEAGLANLASSVNLNLQYDYERDFWENAAAFHEAIGRTRTDVAGSMERLYTFMRLNEDVFGAGYHAQYGMYKNPDMIAELRNVLMLDIKKKTLDFSNIGELPVEHADEGRRVRDCYVIPNFTVTCDWMFAAVSFENALRFSFVYSSRRISHDVAEKIMSRIIGCLGKNV